MAAPQSVRDGSPVGQPDTPGVRVLGYVRGSRRDGLDCESPLQVVRRLSTGELVPETWVCSNHRSSRCRPCAARYRRRVGSVALDGLRSPRTPDARDYLLTLTPPGDGPHCKKAGCGAAPFCRHELCPCTPWEGVDLAVWNTQASRFWNALLTLIERHYGTRPAYFRAAEVQDGKRRDDRLGRGGLHFHVLVSIPAQLARRGDDGRWRALPDLRRLAIEAGFGHEVDVQPIDGRSAGAAEYVTKLVAGYVTKSADLRDDVPWLSYDVDRSTGEVTESTAPTFRTWSQSKTWGTTMAAIRAASLEKARELAAQRQAGPDSVPAPALRSSDSETPPAPS